MAPRARPPRFDDGTLLVRLRVPDRGWASRLPRVPEGRVLTVTVGTSALLPVPVDDLVDNGYRVVGAAAGGRGIGPTVDVLVPADLRREHPAWWRELLTDAERVFDLRLGPVLEVLANELELHRAHAAS